MKKYDVAQALRLAKSSIKAADGRIDRAGFELDDDKVMRADIEAAHDFLEVALGRLAKLLGDLKAETKAVRR